MKILPVVDLLGGQVVRAIRGERSEYRPLESPRITEPTASCVGRFLATMCGFREAYVADLDRIQGNDANWPAWRELVDAGLSLWLDAGATTAEHGLSLFQCLAKLSPRNRLIAGLETLSGLDDLASLVGQLGAESIVFSLDLRNGKPLLRQNARPAAWSGHSPLEIAQQVVDSGCRTIILLDLADVGTGRGLSTLPLMESLCGEHPGVEWWVGGGIAGKADIAAAAAAGASGCLVGSAIYDGKI